MAFFMSCCSVNVDKNVDKKLSEDFSSKENTGSSTSSESITKTEVITESVTEPEVVIIGMLPDPAIIYPGSPVFIEPVGIAIPPNVKYQVPHYRFRTKPQKLQSFNVINQGKSIGFNSLQEALSLLYAWLNRSQLSKEMQKRLLLNLDTVLKYITIKSEDIKPANIKQSSYDKEKKQLTLIDESGKEFRYIMSDDDQGGIEQINMSFSDNFIKDEVKIILSKNHVSFNIKKYKNKDGASNENDSDNKDNSDYKDNAVIIYDITIYTDAEGIVNTRGDVNTRGLNIYEYSSQPSTNEAEGTNKVGIDEVTMQEVYYNQKFGTDTDGLSYLVKRANGNNMLIETEYYPSQPVENYREGRSKISPGPYYSSGQVLSHSERPQKVKSTKVELDKNGYTMEVIKDHEGNTIKIKRDKDGKLISADISSVKMRKKNKIFMYISFYRSYYYQDDRYEPFKFVDEEIRVEHNRVSEQKYIKYIKPAIKYESSSQYIDIS